MLEGKTRSPEVRLTPFARVLPNTSFETIVPGQSTSERPAHSVAGTVAAAGDGDGAHDHDRRFSDYDGGTTLARH